MTRRFLLAAAAGGIAAGGCGDGSGKELSVYAASSLAIVMPELAARFEGARPGWRVRLNLAASSTLRVQIEQGAAADVFASADWAQMEPLRKRGLVREPGVLARNRLAVVVPARNPAGLASPRDLARPGLRLVAAAEQVPAGRYTRLLLEQLEAQPGYPGRFAARAAANVVSREANVRAVLARVELGEADAGVVYASDARGSRRVRPLAIPDAAVVSTEYPIAVVAAARHPEAADALVELALAPPGRALLLRHGFE